MPWIVMLCCCYVMTWLIGVCTSGYEVLHYFKFSGICLVSDDLFYRHDIDKSFLALCYYNLS